MMKSPRFRFAMLCFSYSPLGQLLYMRIWHDNSGRGEYAGWYLNYILVRDIQTQKKYHFIVNRWLAVEEDDGMVSNHIQVYINFGFSYP